MVHGPLSLLEFFRNTNSKKGEGPGAVGFYSFTLLAAQKVRSPPEVSLDREECGWTLNFCSSTPRVRGNSSSNQPAFIVLQKLRVHSRNELYFARQEEVGWTDNFCSSTPRIRGQFEEHLWSNLKKSHSPLIRKKLMVHSPPIRKSSWSTVHPKLMVHPPS